MTNSGHCCKTSLKQPSMTGGRRQLTSKNSGHSCNTSSKQPSMGIIISCLGKIAEVVSHCLPRLLAFNVQKFRGSRKLSTPPFGKKWSHVRTVPGNTCVNLKSVALAVLELLAFNAYFKLVRLTGPLRIHTHGQTDRQTDRQTDIERAYYLRHSLRSFGVDNNLIYKAP